MIPRPPRPVGMELNLAPMVDVMMCLIIFFMLASTLVDAESRPLNLPYAVAAKEIEKKELGARVVINVRKAAADERITEYVVARFEPQSDGNIKLVERVLEPRDVEGYLKAAKARADAAKDEIRCVIRGDKEVMYRDIEVVLRGCGLAKIAKITFSANAGDEPAAPAGA